MNKEKILNCKHDNTVEKQINETLKSVKCIDCGLSVNVALNVGVNISKNYVANYCHDHNMGFGSEGFTLGATLSGGNLRRGFARCGCDGEKSSGYLLAFDADLTANVNVTVGGLGHIANAHRLVLGFGGFGFQINKHYSVSQQCNCIILPVSGRSKTDKAELE